MFDKCRKNGSVTFLIVPPKDIFGQSLYYNFDVYLQFVTSEVFNLDMLCHLYSRNII
jgi:hypothetical protein